MPTLTQAVTTYEAKLNEVVEVFTAANGLANTKAGEASNSAIAANADAGIATTKAAEALASQQASAHIYPGGYAADPLTRPDGSARQIGDEAFNSAAGLKKRWNGATWQASDISTANLAATDGSLLIGYDGGTVQSVMDDAKPMASYAALRAYTGRATGVRITAAGIAGFFQRDSVDASSADNGGTTLVDAALRRWKRLISGNNLPEWFGALADGVTDDAIAIKKAMALPGVTQLAPKKYAISEELTIPRLYCGLIGTNQAVSPGSDGVTVLKWIGAAGATMCRVPNQMHGPQFKNLQFDCNNLANIGLHLDAGAGGSIQFPTLEKLSFKGYLRAGVVLGADDIVTLRNGQLQMCSMRDITWGGAGAAANPAAVFGMILNAQNCEVASLHNVYFDPFTSIGGGPYINHQNHIKVVSGGLNILGMTGTRSTSYAIDVVVECGLVIDQYRSEDILLINYPNSAGLPSNPISIRNIDHRSGLATGLDDAIVLRFSGDTQVTIENCRITGNVKLGGNVAKRIRARNVQYRPGTSATGATVILGPILANMSLEESPGSKVVYNTTAKEEWRSNDGNNTLLYKNDAGRLSKIRGISSNGTPAENLGGVITVTGAATSQALTFATPEADAGYRIVASPLAITGAPAAGSNQVTKVDRTATGFTLNVEAAPGGTTSVTFAWFLFRA